MKQKLQVFGPEKPIVVPFLKKHTGSIKKLTAVLLAFLFILTPIAPALAQEAPLEAPTTSIMDNAGDADSSGSTDGSPVLPGESASTPNSETSSGDEGIASEKDNSSILNEDNSDSEISSIPSDDSKAPGSEEDPPLNMLDSEDPVPPPNPDMDSSYKRLQLPTANTESGALNYEYPISIPPGRNKLQPDLKLSYNNQMGEDSNVFGYGWSINIPYIERVNKKGTDNLYSTTTPIYFASSLTGELATTTSTSTFVSRVDNGDFLSYTFSNDSWTFTDKNGVNYKFGNATSTRQDNPGNSSQIYRWMLEEVRDTNNNYIKYQYYKDAGQIYPSSIIYTGNNTTDGIFEVEFLRQSRSDTATTTKSGFEVVSNYRINEVKAEVNNSWVRKYAISYGSGSNDSRSLITSITESGQDELSNVTALPATSFTYQAETVDFTLDNNWTIPVYFNTAFYYDNGVRLADVNGDGLQDLVHASGATGTLTTYLNSGSSFTASSTWASPEYFTNSNNEDIGTRMIDINGDGLPDVLRSQNLAGTSSAESVYINNGSGWTEDNTWDIPLYFVDSVQKDYGVRLADINGDGLPDILRSKHNGGSDEVKSVHINNGHGWTEDASWTIPTHFVNISSRDLGVRIT